MRRWYIPAVLTAATIVAGCSSPTEHNVVVPATIIVTPPVDTLPVHVSAQLTAAAKDAAGNVLSGISFTWSTSNPAIAVVDSVGHLTALAPGSVVVSATAAGRVGQATVVVSASSGGGIIISVTPTTDTMTAGALQQFTAVGRDSSGVVVPGLVFSWSSSNTAVARVSGSGMVTAVAAGSVSIIASANGFGGAANLVVTAGSSGPTVTFSTFLAGIGDDQIRDIASDAQGNIYVAGGTESSNFPTTPGAFDRTHDNTPNGTVALYDGFVSKFDPAGHLVWSTFLGGSGYDRVYAVEADAQGYVYVAGRTGGGLPITAGAAQTTFQGGAVALYGDQDGFVCKFTPNGSAVVFCTYFGTTDANIIRDIDIDSQGNVYIASATGVSYPSNLGWFTNGYQPTKDAGEDGVVAKLSSDGSTIEWATYIGGSGTEYGQPSIRVDGQGNVWYLTVTGSTDMPLVNPAQAQNNGGQDIYLAKFSGDGTQLLFSTYLGGNGTDGSETHNLAVNRSTGDVYVGSTTTSTNLPTTSGSLQPNFAGGPNEGMLAHYSNSGALLSETYLGSSSTDGDDIQGITVGADGRVYLSGSGMANHATMANYGAQGGRDGAAFILSSDIKHVDFGVAIGGVSDDGARAVAALPNGGIVVGGITMSSDLPVKNANQSTYIGAAFDAFLVKFQP